MGSAVFSRIEDMFSFFRSDDLKININYFSEKMVAAPVDCYKKFNFDAFEEEVNLFFNKAFLKSTGEEVLAFKSDAKDSLDNMLDICRDFSENEDFCMAQAMDWRYNRDSKSIELIDFWETGGFLEITNIHIWRLYAIVWAIQQYDLSLLKSIKE